MSEPPDLSLAPRRRAPADPQVPSPPGRARRGFTTVRDAYLALRGRGVDFTHQPLGRHIDATGVVGYYCDFRHKARVASAHADGFPRRTSTGERSDFSIPIAQAALGYWELRLDGEPTERPFLAVVDWLVENAVEGPGGLVWRSARPQAKYGLAPGWASAMGQGEAMSALLRAHALSGRDRYLEVARAAYGPMTVEVADGGVMRTFRGQPVLEEYPADQPTAVLNGWIFALFGVHELANVTGDEQVRAYFDRSLDGLLALLPEYDAGWWSLYSLYEHGRPDLAKPFYQRLHPVLLDGLHLVRPDPLLDHFARRWEAQLTRRAVARNAVDKLRFRADRALRDRSS